MAVLHKRSNCSRKNSDVGRHVTANPTNGSGTNGQVAEGGAGVVSPTDDEVTRIDAVRHHAGVVGHGALSPAFLAAAVVLVGALGRTFYGW